MNINKVIKKILGISFGLAIVLVGGIGFVQAEERVNLNIRSGEAVIFSGAVLFPASATELQGQTVNSASVLAILNDADLGDDSWEISDLQYFDSFGSFYLKCIDSSAGNDCDDWQYTVDGDYPGAGMDQTILSGGENIYAYFGPQNRIGLVSGETITTADDLVVATEAYDYENNAWVVREGIIVGLTQPNSDDPFSPVEIRTAPVDANGRAIFSNIPAGNYDVGGKEDFYFPTEELTVTEPVENAGSGSSGTTSGSRKKTTGSVLGVSTQIQFDLPKAYEFIISQQSADGSFGPDIYTDWTGLALASGNYQQATINLIKYLTTVELKGTMLTDFERHAMVLMALGLNPYNTNGVNYIEKILAAFDGRQFGDIQEDNDDIFALLVLFNAGYGPEDEMIKKCVEFVLGRQKENGSWDESIDMTGAALAVLVQTEENEAVQNATTKAKTFLQETQSKRNDGSWADNVSSTAWALEGILALGEKQEDWERSGNTPVDYLATMQDADGGIKGENINSRIWETAYAISAASGKTWSQTMQKFEKQEIKPAPQTKKAAPPPEPEIEKEIPPPATAEVSEPPKSWFKKLLENIFGLYNN